MEMMFFVAVFGVQLLIGLVVALCVSTAVLLSLKPQPPIRPARLLLGYLAGFLAALILSAWMSYVSREGALKLGVRAEFYWPALWDQFKLIAFYVVYVTVFGIAVIGAPAICVMTMSGFGSVPWTLLASFVISAAFLLLLLALGVALPLSSATRLIGAHLFLTLMFSLGVGLPLARPRPYPSGIDPNRAPLT